MERVDEITLMYENIPKFFKSRGVTPTTDLPPPKEFIRTTIVGGYAFVVGKFTPLNTAAEKEHTLVLIITAKGSDAGRKKQVFKSMLGGIKKTLKTFANTNIVIFSEKATSKKVIDFDAVINEFAEPGSEFHVETYDYEMLIINPNETEIVPRHILLTQEEAKKLNRAHYTDYNQRAAILSDDPPVVWIGGKVGDLIKIVSDSVTVGRAVNYRLVVPAE